MEIFVSDLDGTLLDGRARISKNSEEILNRLADDGLWFTVATARTPLSAIPILSNLRLRLPVILLGGGMLYDINRHRILQTAGFGKDRIRRIAKVERQTGMGGLFLSVAENAKRSAEISLNLGTVKRSLWEHYFDLGVVSGISTIRTDFLYRGVSELADACVVYGLYMDDRPEKLAEMTRLLRREPGLTLDFYKDIYTENRWCLELTNGDVSKKTAVMELRRRYPKAHILGFGDGENDLPLFEACDEAYAVANAAEAVKLAADGVIGSNLEEGVAVYIRSRVTCIKKERSKNYAENSDRESLPAEYGGEGKAL